MSTASQTITFTSTPPITAAALGRWLRLTTDPPEEESPVTKAQLAAALDQLVGITDHCTGQTVDPAGVDQKLEKGLGTQASCDQTASALGTGQNCTAAARSGQAIKKTVYVHWSDLDLAENYQLVPLGSALITSGPQRIRQVLHLVIDVTNARSAPLRYYIDQEALIPLLAKTPPRWIGGVVQGKRIVQGPSITIGGDRVYWGTMVSGRLELWIPILADHWELALPGVFIGDKRSYKAKILAVSDMLETPAELEIEDETEGNPAANDCRPCGGAAAAWTDEEVEESGSTTTIASRVYCYIRIDWILYTSCLGKSVDSGTDYQQAECPEGNLTATVNRGLFPIPGLPDYIYEVARISQERWTGTDEITITAAEYKDKCCYDPVRENCMPPCKTRRSTWTGQVWPGVEADLKQRYGQNTEIVYVAPLGGICGTRTDEFVEPHKNCNCRVVITYILGCGWNSSDYMDYEAKGYRADLDRTVDMSGKLQYNNNCGFDGIVTLVYNNRPSQTIILHVDYNLSAGVFIPDNHAVWDGTDPEYIVTALGFSIVPPSQPSTNGFVYSSRSATSNRTNPLSNNEISRSITPNAVESGDAGWACDGNYVTYTAYMSCTAAETFTPSTQPQCPE